MKTISHALNELYLANEEPGELEIRVENAIEILQDGLDSLGCQMASAEVADLIQKLNNGEDIEPIIFELEVINNEL